MTAKKLSWVCHSQSPRTRGRPYYQNELLAEFKRKDSQCALQDCKKSVLTRGQKCRYCSNVYCLGHHLPEVHGCAQAAKEQARSATSAPKQMSQKAAVKRGQLERKFENKIKDMEKKRKNKNKNEKKIAERELLNSDYD